MWNPHGSKQFKEIRTQSSWASEEERGGTGSVHYLIVFWVIPLPSFSPRFHLGHALLQDGDRDGVWSSNQPALSRRRRGHRISQATKLLAACAKGHPRACFQVQILRSSSQSKTNGSRKRYTVATRKGGNCTGLAVIPSTSGGWDVQRGPIPVSQGVFWLSERHTVSKSKFSVAATFCCIILCAVLHCASIFVGLSWTQGRAAVNPLHKVGSTSRGCAGSWIRSSSVPSRDVNPKAHFAVHLLVAGLEQPGPHAHQWPEAQLAQTAHSRSCQIQSLSPCSLANFGNDCVVRKGRVFWTCFDSTVSP